METPRLPVAPNDPKKYLKVPEGYFINSAHRFAQQAKSKAAKKSPLSSAWIYGLTSTAGLALLLMIWWNLSQEPHADEQWAYQWVIEDSWTDPTDDAFYIAYDIELPTTQGISEEDWILELLSEEI